jgi:hypothetical protein
MADDDEQEEVGIWSETERWDEEIQEYWIAGMGEGNERSVLGDDGQREG